MPVDRRNGTSTNTRTEGPVIAHVLVEAPSNRIVEHCVALVTALSELGFAQRVLTGSATLNRRLALCLNVEAGPPVHSAIGACCSVGDVQVVHAYDITAAQAALILRLTRSIPYLLELDDDVEWPSSVACMVVRRAFGVNCQSRDQAAAISADLDIVRTTRLPRLRYASATNPDRDRDPVDHYARLYRLAADCPDGPATLAN